MTINPTRTSYWRDVHCAVQHNPRLKACSGQGACSMHDSARERLEMVESQIIARGIKDRLVLEAMRAVPRELFVPPENARSAYLDGPLPIGAGQTISQPYVVALMVEALQLTGGEHVLEIGAGSGYAAAVLAQIAGSVTAIEYIPQLCSMARSNLDSAGAAHVQVYCADGSVGWPRAAPYDAILVSAGAPDIPGPLKEQLKIGGRLVVPVGADRSRQNLLRISHTGTKIWEVEDLGPVHFVPLVGKSGWKERP